MNSKSVIRTTVVSFTNQWRENYPECGPSASIRIVINCKGLMRSIMNEEIRRGSPNVYGFPGGGVEAGETHFAAMVRELKEETGYTFDQSWTYKYTILSPSGVTYVYFANNYQFKRPIPQTTEVARVIFMRDSEIMKAIELSSPLTCENITLRFRKCQFDILRALPNFCLIDPILLK